MKSRLEMARERPVPSRPDDRARPSTSGRTEVTCRDPAPQTRLLSRRRASRLPFRRKWGDFPFPATGPQVEREAGQGSRAAVAAAAAAEAGGGGGGNGGAGAGAERSGGDEGWGLRGRSAPGPAGTRAAGRREHGSPRRGRSGLMGRRRGSGQGAGRKPGLTPQLGASVVSWGACSREEPWDEAPVGGPRPRLSGGSPRFLQLLGKGWPRTPGPCRALAPGWGLDQHGSQPGVLRFTGVGNWGAHGVNPGLGRRGLSQAQ